MAIQHTFLWKDGLVKSQKLTPMKAIRSKCMECSNFQFSEVTKCNVELCALFPFRSGKTGMRKAKKTAENLKKG